MCHVILVWCKTAQFGNLLHLPEQIETRTRNCDLSPVRVFARKELMSTGVYLVHVEKLREDERLVTTVPGME